VQTEAHDRDSGERLTRLSCPDCSGVLAVRHAGVQGHVVFICRVGHRYSIGDVVAAKEERLEDRLWAALQSLQELADLLGELSRHAESQRLASLAAVFADRARRAEAHAGRVRAIIEESQATEVPAEAVLIRGRASS
jgi:two-component system chemotaxis response regulator CheB